MEKEIKRFKVGQHYSCRSACNHDCVWTYIIAARTEKTIVLQDRYGTQKMCRIDQKKAERFGYESVYPLGKYSMCPVLSADR